jgi:serine/threonine-protein kinase
MLCGHPPFVADDVTAVMYQIAKIDPPPLSKEVPGLPPEAEEVLMKALSKRHTARHSSIREFARAFESAVLGYATELTPLPGMRVLTDKGELLVRDRTAQGVTPGPVGDASRGEGVAWITEKVKRLRVPRWPILVGAGVVAAVLVVVGVLRTHAPVASKAAPAALAPVATQAQVVPLPDAPPTATATETTDPSGSNLPSAAHKRGKSKVGTDLGTEARAGKAKKKAGLPKHRLFEKL